MTRRCRSEGIVVANWIEGQETIEFTTGNELEGPAQQVYRLNVLTGELKRLLDDVPTGQSVESFHTQAAGMIYTLAKLVPPPKPYPIYALTPKLLSDAVNGNTGGRAEEETYARYAERPVWPLRSGSVGFIMSYPRAMRPWFSPDGRRAVMLRVPEKKPEGWAGYREPPRTFSTPKEVGQFMWIDLEKGEESPLLDAPWGVTVEAGAQVEPRALWSADGGRVVLVNTALPLQGEGASAERAGMTYIVSYDVMTRSWKVLEPVRNAAGMTVKDVSWREPGKSFLVRRQRDGKAMPGTVYEWRGGRWEAKTVGASVVAPTTVPAISDMIKVRLQQSQNDPPVIVASREGREVVLTPPDPALDGVRIARTESYSWKDGEGMTRTAALTLPPTPAAGRKIPLVIQVKGYEPELFHPNGPYSTAFATQALAAQGMAVLTMGSPEDGLPGGRVGQREIGQYIDWLETSSESLSRTHGIDLERVGVIGFSRTGYLLRHAITHPRRLHLGAAIIADSASGTYTRYLVYHATGEGRLTQNYENAYGGPFYQAKSAWLENELSFNVDRIQTPVLFADNGTLSPAFIIDTYGAFTLAHKPFDYLMVASQYHEIEEVQPLRASQEATVDWMNFWLNGRETPRTDDPDRYVRWHKIKSDWEQQQATENSTSTSASATAVQETTQAPSAEADLQRVHAEMKAAGVADPGSNPSILNTKAYRAMYEQNDTVTALRDLRWNLTLFSRTPFEAEAHDSVAEGCLIAGDRDCAIEHYTAALKLNPQIQTKAASFLQRLKLDPSSLDALRAEARNDYAAASTR